MKPTVCTSAEMIDLVSRAIDRHRPGGAEEIHEEHLILLATGRLEELPPPERSQLLRQVAAQPWAARVIREIRDLGVEPIASVPVVNAWRFRMAVAGMAMAACLMTAVTVWYVGGAGSPGGSNWDPRGMTTGTSADQQAFEAYLRQAEAGDPDAMDRVARCYEKGIGVQRDPQMAEQWRQRAKQTRATR